MSDILVILGRLLLITTGYVAASLAASAFLNLMTLGALFDADELVGMAAGTFFTIPFIALFVAYFAFIPSVVVIALAELLRRRDWLTYALAGGAVGLVVLGMFWQATGNMYDVADALDPAAQGTRSDLSDPFIAMLMIGAGMVGGIAYWLVAGRLGRAWRATSPGR